MDYTGTTGDDSVIGTAQADSFITNGGNDTFDGGAGDDVVHFNALGTLIFIGGDGFDLIDLRGSVGESQWALGDDLEGFIGGQGSDLVSLNDVLQLTSHRLSGKGGDDILSGGNGRDLLNGGGGADLLTTYGGADTLTGGKAGDRFDFSPDIMDPKHAPLITDLENKDSIALDGWGAKSLKEISVSYDAEHDVTLISLDLHRDGVVDYVIEAQGDHSDYAVNHHHFFVG